MTKAACDRCGFTVKHDTCRVEWTGLFVCSQCYDPRLVYLDPPRINPNEGMPVKNARLDPTPVYADDDNPTLETDL